MAPGSRVPQWSRPCGWSGVPWRGPADPRAMPAMAMRAMGTMGSMGSMEAMEAMEMETWKIWDLIGFGLANVIDVLNMFVADH